MPVNLKNAISRVLELSKADQTIVIARQSSETNLRWANSGLTTNASANVSFLAVISIIDQQAGTYVTDLDDTTDLEMAVRSSEIMAQKSPKSPDYMPLINGKDAWSQVSTGQEHNSTVDLSRALGQVFKKAKNEGYSLFGYAEQKLYEYYLATSTGLRKQFSSTQGQFELNAKTPDYKLSVWSGSSLKNFSEINPAALYEGLSAKLKWSKTQLNLPPGKYEVILEPSALADLLLYAYWSSSARMAEEGQSAFSARGGGTVVGKKLYNSNINVYSDPHEPGLETAPFNTAFYSSNEESLFDNGLELKRTDWIKNGVQTNLISTRHLAKKYNYQQTTPFIPNLIFKHDGPKLGKMISSTKRALLITTLWYIREVDPQNLLLTGLTRDGVFLIENGKVKGAVNNFRFNMSPIQMLNNVIEIGQSQNTLAREFGDYFPLAHMPPVRVEDFNMSSVSKAK